MRSGSYRIGASQPVPTRQYDRLPGAERENTGGAVAGQTRCLGSTRKIAHQSGAGTSIDFGLKIIDLLVGREKAYEVASQLVMAAGIYNYYEA